MRGAQNQLVSWLIIKPQGLPDNFTFSNHPQFRLSIKRGISLWDYFLRQFVVSVYICLGHHILWCPCLFLLPTSQLVVSWLIFALETTFCCVLVDFCLQHRKVWCPCLYLSRVSSLIFSLDTLYLMNFYLRHHVLLCPLYHYSTHSQPYCNVGQKAWMMIF